MTTEGNPRNAGFLAYNVGVRITSLPITAEKVRQALQKRLSHLGLIE